MFIAEDNDTYCRQMIPANDWSFRRGEIITPVIAWLLFDFWDNGNLNTNEQLPHKSQLLLGKYDPRIELCQIIKALLATGELIPLDYDEGEFFLSAPNAIITGRGDAL